MKQLLVIGLVLGLFGCNESRTLSLKNISLTGLNGREVNFGDITANRIVVLIFMSPDCPLCINYTKTIMELNSKFSEKQVVFLTVYSGTHYEISEIIKFHSQYEYNLTGYLDPGYKLAHMVMATVTPQAVVVDTMGRIAYSGAIDDWMYETGRKRTVITHHYLESALLQLASGKRPDPYKTEPIGCYIE